MEEKKMPSKEVIAKAMQCETSEQLIELAKTEGIELTKEEAEAYLVQLQDVELTEEDSKAVAAGRCELTQGDFENKKKERCPSKCYHSGW